MNEENPIFEEMKEEAEKRRKEPWEMTREEFSALNPVQQNRQDASFPLIGQREQGWKPGRDYKDYREVHAIGAYLDTDKETAKNRKHQWEVLGQNVSEENFSYAPGKTLDVTTDLGRKELAEIQDLAFHSGNDYQEELTNELKRREYRYVSGGGFLGEQGELISLYPDDDLKTHRQHIESAISQGKPVPPEVIADYPDLQAKADSAQQDLSDLFPRLQDAWEESAQSPPDAPDPSPDLPETTNPLGDLSGLSDALDDALAEMRGILTGQIQPETYQQVNPETSIESPPLPETMTHAATPHLQAETGTPSAKLPETPRPKEPTLPAVAMPGPDGSQGPGNQDISVVASPDYQSPEMEGFEPDEVTPELPGPVEVTSGEEGFREPQPLASAQQPPTLPNISRPEEQKLDIDSLPPVVEMPEFPTSDSPELPGPVEVVQERSEPQAQESPKMDFSDLDPIEGNPALPQIDLGEALKTSSADPEKVQPGKIALPDYQPPALESPTAELPNVPIPDEPALPSPLLLSPGETDHAEGEAPAVSGTKSVNWQPPELKPPDADLPPLEAVDTPTLPEPVSTQPQDTEREQKRDDTDSQDAGVDTDPLLPGYQNQALADPLPNPLEAVDTPALPEPVPTQPQDAEREPGQGHAEQQPSVVEWEPPELPSVAEQGRALAGVDTDPLLPGYQNQALADPTSVDWQAELMEMLQEAAGDLPGGIAQGDNADMPGMSAARPGLPEMPGEMPALPWNVLAREGLPGGTGFGGETDRAEWMGQGAMGGGRDDLGRKIDELISAVEKLTEAMGKGEQNSFPERKRYKTGG